MTWDFPNEIQNVEEALETHNCSDEELGLTNSPNSMTYPLIATATSVSFYKKKFKCINKENLTMYGDFNS